MGPMLPRLLTNGFFVRWERLISARWCCVCSARVYVKQIGSNPILPMKTTDSLSLCEIPADEDSSGVWIPLWGGQLMLMKGGPMVMWCHVSGDQHWPYPVSPSMPLHQQQGGGNNREIRLSWRKVVKAPGCPNPKPRTNRPQVEWRRQGSKKKGISRVGLLKTNTFVLNTFFSVKFLSVTSGWSGLCG